LKTQTHTTTLYVVMINDISYNTSAILYFVEKDKDVEKWELSFKHKNQQSSKYATEDPILILCVEIWCSDFYFSVDLSTSHSGMHRGRSWAIHVHSKRFIV